MTKSLSDRLVEIDKALKCYPLRDSSDFLRVYSPAVEAVISNSTQRLRLEAESKALRDLRNFNYIVWDASSITERPMSKMLSVASAAYERAVAILERPDCALSEVDVKVLLKEMMLLWRYGHALEDMIFDWHLRDKIDSSLRELDYEVSNVRRHVRLIYGRGHGDGKGVSYIGSEKVLERTCVRLEETFGNLCARELNIRHIVGPASPDEIHRASREFAGQMCDEIVELSMAASLAIESNFEARVFADG